MKLRLLVLATILMAGAVAAPGNAQNAQSDYIVLFESHEARSAAPVHAAGGTVTGGQDVDVAPVLFTMMSDTAAEALEKNPNVEAVTENQEVKALGQSTPWGISRVKADEVHSYNKGSSSTEIAILDTGIAKDHEDLQGQVAWGYSTAGPNREGTQYTEDGNGHGTHVAGTVAALDNDLGVVGMAPESDLYAIEVLYNDGTGDMTDIIEGVDVAAKGPDGELGTSDDADVISMSLGSDRGDPALKEALQTAYNDDTLNVAAAGNDGNPGGGGDKVSYPARYDSVMAVAATNQQDQRADFSSTGPDVEIAAPGVSINSTVPTDCGTSICDSSGYNAISGTSMAAPHVSGLAALIFNSENPDGDGWTAQEVRQQIRETAVDLGKQGRDDKYGYGLIDAKAAVPYTPDKHDVAVTSVEAPSSMLEGGSTLVNVTVENQGTYQETANVTLVDSYDSEIVGWSQVNLSSGSIETVSFSYTADSGELGDHVLNATAEIPQDADTSDNSKTATVTVDEPIHDIAATSVSVQSSVNLGDSTTVDVTLENQGDYEETFDVTLESDNTSTGNAYLIGSRNVTLAAGEVRTETFTWDTTGSSQGTHTLTANASYLSTETEYTDNTASATSEVVTGSSTDMYVSSITFTEDTHGPWTDLLATVTVRHDSDSDGTAEDTDGVVSDATVDAALAHSSGTWTYSGITDGSGQVTFERKKASSGDYTLEVTGLSHSTYSWNKNLGIVSGSVTVN